jgi:hypothetical protein
MMGATHGLTGIAAGVAIAGALHATGTVNRRSDPHAPRPR